VNDDQFYHMTDQQLLDNYYSLHDSKSLGILLERYTLLLLGVCMKYLKNEEEAKDGVQQIFLKTITELQKYKVVYFKSWIYMVAKNHCLMKIRDKQGKIPVELDDKFSTAPDITADSSAFWQNDKSLELLSASLKELNPEQQQCVTLFYLEKKSYQEISGLTGYSLLQVKSFIQNGKRNLKIMIERKLKEKA